jgi:hypothetical protein
LGTSVARISTAIVARTRRTRQRIVERTVDSLAVLPGVTVEDRVLVLGLHLGLSGHLGPPLVNGGDLGSGLREGVLEAVDNTVNTAKTLSLAVLLGSGHPPWDFPAPG